MNAPSAPPNAQAGAANDTHCFTDAATAQMERLMTDFGRMYRERNDALQEVARAHHDALLRLARAAEYRDDDTGVHIVRMGWLAGALALRLGMDPAWALLLRQAAPMHDVGKIGMPDAVLKKAGKLTPDERAVMNGHPRIGAEILGRSRIPLFQLAAEAALTHHERWDGSGYPQGLAGEAIPLSGRIVAVVDFVDALTMDRCYRPAFADDVAMDMLLRERGRAFDPRVVDAFVAGAPELLALRDRITQERPGLEVLVDDASPGLATPPAPAAPLETAPGAWPAPAPALTPAIEVASAPEPGSTFVPTQASSPSPNPAPLLRTVAVGLAVCLAMFAAPTPAQAGQVQERVRAAGQVKVCIWPDYYGISLRHPRTQQLQGLDIDLSAELGRDLKLGIQYVDSSFQTLVEDLKTDRCDVAMFAVGTLPQRVAALSFTRPYMQSDIYAVTSKGSRVVTRWEDIDKPGVAVAVQAGTFMEPVMAAALKQARLVRVSPPATRERELEAGRVDVFMTDYPYSRRLLDNADWATLISPPGSFYPLPYAYAVKQGDAAWLAQVDEFVARIQRDGRLAAAARRHGLEAIVRLK